MVAYFLCVGELLGAHGLVRHGDPRGRFCFVQSSRMSSLVGAIHHRHMTNPTMDSFRTSVSGFD